MDTFVFHSSGVILSASSTLIKQKQHKMVVSSCQDSKHCESLAARGVQFCDTFESDASQSACEFDSHRAPFLEGHLNCEGSESLLRKSQNADNLERNIQQSTQESPSGLQDLMPLPV